MNARCSVDLLSVCSAAVCNESRTRALINDFHLPNSNRGGRRTIKLSSSNKTLCKRCVPADVRQMYVCLYVSIKTVLYTEYTAKLISLLQFFIIFQHKYLNILKSRYIYLRSKMKQKYILFSENFIKFKWVMCKKNQHFLLLN